MQKNWFIKTNIKNEKNIEMNLVMLIIRKETTKIILYNIKTKYNFFHFKKRRKK